MTRDPYAATQPGGYERRIGRYGASLADAFVAACRLRRGQTVLDVGCGTGALTVRLARVVGGACVAAVDPAPNDAARCAERVPSADVRVAEAEALPFGAAPCRRSPAMRTSTTCGHRWS